MSCFRDTHSSRFALRALMLGVLLASACGHDSSPLADPDGGVDGNGEGDGGIIDPSAPDEVLFQAALADWNAMLYADAETKFDQLLAQYPDSPRRDNSAYLSGRCRYELLDFPGARDALVAMRQDYPTSPFAGAAAYFTGRARYRLTPPDYAGAVLDFQSSLSEDPQGTFADNAQYFLGRAYYQLADYTNAITALTAFEATYPNSTYVDNGNYYLGRCYFNQQDYSGALPHFQDVFETTDSIYADDAQFYIGRCHYGLGSLATALGDFQDLESGYAASQYVDNAIYYELRVYVDQIDCTNANATYTRLETAFPTSNYLPLAQMYLTNGGC